MAAARDRIRAGVLLQLNTAWKASHMTYTAQGNQYVAVAAGENVIAFGLRA
jgi:hypothetical protein